MCSAHYSLPLFSPNPSLLSLPSPLSPLPSLLTPPHSPPAFHSSPLLPPSLQVQVWQCSTGQQLQDLSGDGEPVIDITPFTVNNADYLSLLTSHKLLVYKWECPSNTWVNQKDSLFPPDYFMQLFSLCTYCVLYDPLCVYLWVMLFHFCLALMEVYIHWSFSVSVCVRENVCAHISMCVWMCAHSCVLCVCLCLCMHTFICVCTCMHQNVSSSSSTSTLSIQDSPLSEYCAASINSLLCQRFESQFCIGRSNTRLTFTVLKQQCLLWNQTCVRVIVWQFLPFWYCD